jgi:hypothetical protein
MRKAVLAVLLILMSVPSALGDFYDGPVLVTETCLNVTHSVLFAQYVTSNGTAQTTYNISQTVPCTYNCSSNRCSGTDAQADLNIAWSFLILSLFLLGVSAYLGMPFGLFAGRDTPRTFDTMMAVRLIFFFLGIWILSLANGTFTGMGRTYGASIGATSAAETMVMVCTVLSGAFLIIFMVDFVFYLLKRYMEASDGRWKVYDGQDSARR